MRDREHSHLLHRNPLRNGLPAASSLLRLRGSAAPSGTRSPNVRPLGLLALAAALLALALIATPASAGQVHLSEGVFGSAAQPTFSNPAGIAVDQSSGDLLVIEAGANRIARYHADGTPADFSALSSTNFIDGAPGEADATPQGGIGFSVDAVLYSQIAVDNSGTATDGDIYVTQNLQGSAVHAIDVFARSGEYLGQLTGGGAFSFAEGAGVSPCGVTADSAGNVYVSTWNDKKIYKFDPSANPPVNDDLAGTPFLTSGAFQRPCQLAAGIGPTAGSLFVTDYNGGDAYKLGSSPGPAEYQIFPIAGDTVLSEEAAHPAVNPTNGHVLFGTGGTSPRGVFDFDASGSSAGVLAAKPFGHSPLVAVGPTGKIYLRGSGDHLEVFGPLVPLPDVATGPASALGETTAIAAGTVEANGVEVSQCKFEYGTTTAYGSSKPCAETPAEIGTGTASVHADLTGLAPETAYHYRLVAANANGPADPPGEDRTFQTVSKPQVLGSWSAAVALTEATLKAQIDPQSATTTYRFEWGLAAGPPYEHASADVAIGSEPLPQIVGLPLSGLVSGATYHFRVVAENHCHPETNPTALCTSEGPDISFTTYLPFALQSDCPNQALRAEASAFLPDCRAYEMVSPVDKNGGDVIRGSILPHFPDSYTQAAPDGNRITYTTLAGFGDLEAGVNFNQYLASRGEDGWNGTGIHPAIAGHRVSNDPTEGLRLFYAFTPDLCDGWLIDYQTPAPAGGIDGYPNIYRRHNCSPGQGELEALTDVAPPDLNTESSRQYISPQSGLSGVSADGRHALFIARAKLTPDVPESLAHQEVLYDRFGGAIHLVSIQPNGTPSIGYLGGGFTGQNWRSNLASAVSEEGERVYWNSGSRLFLRLHPEQGMVSGECADNATVACTVAVSKTSTPYFWAASADGARATYTEGATENGVANLYEFDLGREEAEPAEASYKIAEKVEGVLGASRDLSRIYFVSREKLAASEENSQGEEAEEGAHNLYLYEMPVGGGEARYTFVARLSGFDVGQTEPGGEAEPYSLTDQMPYSRATRVSPDGATIAFDSRAPLTGYDNTDTPSGRPAVEVFLYSAADGRLRCASCNPSGARPQTLASMRQPYQFPGADARKTKVPVAAWLPTWEQSPYASRPLSASGKRLFFNSYDALLPRDNNGQMDVYEWEAPGKGDCNEQSPSYFTRNEGCLYLISSGESPYESEIWDASEDGRDVFFTTESSLVPPDPGSIDLYDARVGGGFTYPRPAASCEGEACQSPPAAPDDPTPASSAFEGAGNVVEPPVRPRCRKPKVRRKGRCVARHAHHRKGRTA